MIDPDFLRLVQLGAIETELRLLESGGIPSRTPAPDLSELEVARRAAFLATVGERLLSTSLRD
jgi:hypothetical protein